MVLGCNQRFDSPVRSSSPITFSKYCPYWFFNSGAATSRSLSVSIQPLPVGNALQTGDL